MTIIAEEALAAYPGAGRSVATKITDRQSESVYCRYAIRAAQASRSRRMVWYCSRVSSPRA